MTFDVVKAINEMTERFMLKYGPVHKQETTQHERHLTWVVSAYARDLGISCSNSTENNKPCFGQDYNNLTFKIGYRIGLKEREGAYKEGYDDAMAEIRERLGVR